MSQPIVVTLPHRLGKAEALRRLQVSFRDARSSGAGFGVQNSGPATTWIFAPASSDRALPGPWMLQTITSGLRCNFPGFSRSWPTKRRP